MRVFRRRRRDERGAVALEAALIFPVLMLLVFGMIEFSLLMRDYVSVTSAARAGVRLASSEADAGPCVQSPTDTTLCSNPSAIPEAAQDAADQVDRALTSVDRTAVQYLLVYEANAKGYPCTSSTVVTNQKGVHDTCNTATNLPADTSAPLSCSGYVNCITFVWSASKSAFRYSSGSWNSASIGACTNATDSVGIYVRTDHKMITGIFGSALPVNDRAVAEFEPLSDDTCDASKVAAHK